MADHHPITLIFAVFGARMLIASAVSLAGGPCLAWEGSLACLLGSGN